MTKNLFIVKLQLILFATIILNSISSSAQWVKKADAFQKRSEFAGVVYNSKLYAFLGFKSSALEPNVSSEVYDPVTNKWSLLASIPANAAMTHQGVVLIDNTVWHIGGRVGKNPGPLTSDIWIYNITTDSWSRGPQLTDPATGNSVRWAAGGAVLLGRTIHIFGGFTINGCNNDQDNYHLTLDVDTWLSDKSKPAQWKNNLAPLPRKRNHISSTVMGGKIYAIGGQFGHDCGGGLDQRFSHVYDPSKNTWTELPLLPTPRSHSEGSIFAMDGKIFLFAGQKANNASSVKVTVFEPKGNNGRGKWEDDNSLILPRPYEGLLAKVIGNTFIISGGGNGWSGNPRKETYTHTVARNPVHELEFSSGCSNLDADEDGVVKGKTLLFTIDGSKDYTTSSDADWLKVTKNATGTATPNAVNIEFTANTKGLAPGNYSATITAKGSGSGPSYSDASYCVRLTVKGASPNVAPSVSIKTPVSNTNYAAPATINITATATDADGTISKVEFYNGTQLLHTEYRGTYSYSWQNVPAGTYSLTAKATDNKGKVTTSAVVEVLVGTSAKNTPPSVSITTPVSNTNYAAPATINITAAATDADGTISKVEFYNGTQLLHTEYRGTYSYSWQNVPAGTYSLTAKATDNKGKVTTSAVVEVLVGTSTENTPPSVSITTPVTNKSYTAPARIKLNATATDEDGKITKVQFFNGATLLHTETKLPYGFLWINVPAGMYSITAKATDNKGAVTISSELTISVGSTSSNKPSNFVNNSGTSASSSFNVFPNPAGNTVFVSGKGLPQNKDFMISVISKNGAVLKTVRSNTSNKVVEVNVSSLSPGVYTIKATTGLITLNKQFVKR